MCFTRVIRSFFAWVLGDDFLTKEKFSDFLKVSYLTNDELFIVINVKVDSAQKFDLNTLVLS